MIEFVSFVVVFSVLVLAHELGHFVAAKMTGVRVDEFGLGYPPRLLKLGTWRGTLLTLNALPFGGFVRMSEDDPTVKGSLASKGRTIRILVYVAGALMNVVLAVVLLILTFMLGALIPIEKPGAGIYYVAQGSPAEKAGLRLGDNIVSVNGETVQDVERAIEAIKAHVGQTVEIVAGRDGDVLPPVSVIPRVEPPPNEGALGVALGLPLVKRSYPVWEAVPLGIRGTYNAVRGIFWAIQAAIRKQLPLQVSGVIGMYNMTAEVVRTGLARLLEFTAWLSLNLFLLNLLPLPGLDGGHVIFVLLELVRGGRRVPPEKEGLVHALGMMVLVGFMVVVTYLDYRRYYG